jgi:endonuclease/exonuclease/phosphatase family metal-dependent hydrolase
MLRPLSTRLFLMSSMLAFVIGAPPGAHAAGSDVVIYTSDVSNVQGNWSKVSDGSAAGGQRMTSADQGSSQTDSPLGSPSDYFEATFTAPASTSYHVWLRMRAKGDSKWNDSVWVQFSDATNTSGQAAYRIGSSAGLSVNLATDSGGSSLSGWGWQDKSYWLAQSPIVRFISAGTHTVRVQTREDGAQIDQIVLSPSTYFSGAPGSATGDQTIVAKSGGGSGGGASTPYTGSAAAIPGTIALQDFDNGGEGVAYHDTTSGNTGGAYRSTDVDLGASADGGNNVGWTAAGEWINYSVNVGSAGAYTIAFRVASSGQGGTFHLEMNGSNVTGSLTVPDTGGWQTWRSVSASATLAAGQQMARLVMDSVSGTGAVGNFNSMAFSTGGSSSSSSSSGLSPYSGTPAAVPGTIEAENFDNGGEGVAYHDTTSGNNGGVYRSTDVDVESSSDGGYDIGWAAAGEWLNYTVNVANSGSYTVQLRVASNNGGTLHVGFNGSSSVWKSVSIPSTGGWQAWTTVNVPVTIGAGTQQLTVLFDTGGVNLNSIGVASGSAGGSGGSGGSGGGGGTATTINVAEWNIQINDGSDTHARVAMDALMAISPRPQVIVIEEAYSNLFNTYIDELQRQTGQTWHGTFATHCAPGTWNGSGCSSAWYQGVGIFSSFDITDSGSMLFPFPDCWTDARVGVHAQLNVNGTAVQVFGTHLQTGGCENDAQSRYNSMGMLKSWASNYSGPLLAAGDFNADPDQIDTSSGMSPVFTDTWSIAGSGHGYTSFVPTPTMKIDYWFEDAGGRAAVQSTAVVTSTGSISDHMPLRATVTVQ